MQFFVHGAVSPDAIDALRQHEQQVHTALELSAETDAPAALEDNPRELLKFLQKKQWHLFTTDTGLIHQIYEEKIEFPGGIIVLMLDNPDVLNDQGAAVERLFERYKRLTVKRLYTITASKIKIRQLPGLE